MPSFYGENPPDTEVGSTDATESQISEDAVTETDTSGGFYQGSPEQTTTEAYEADARTARDAALAAQEAAEDAQAAAEASESAASSSESNAASSQSAAATSATNASNSASAAAGSATTAATQASNASTSASEAASSASAAASSESAAASSQSAAASSQTAAAGSATAAASSAGTASTKASEAATSATNAAASESAAASSESNASTSASQAATSATNAAASESAAASSETNAASSASAASTSASNAASSASAASSSATAAASSASSASTSATAAGSARDAALAALDSFDDRYLGQKSSEPSVDNDGNALVAGALFFDTVNTVMKVYDGSQWLAAYASVSGALLAINNLDDVSNTATARSNLGLGTAAEQNVGYFATAAQGSLADSALQNGDNVSVLTNDSGYLTGNETITLTGDVSGSGTTSISVTIADDSHNHVISNVDGLQAALDAKQDASTALTTSNYSTTLDGRYYTETEVGTFFSGSSAITGYNKTNWDTAYGWGNHASAGYLTGNQTITLTGDVSGSGTTSIAVTIADDSHNHVISNVDGLQAALDAKLASSSYTAADVLTKIKTVDGSGSGLDADLLDGQEGSKYLKGYTNVSGWQDSNRNFSVRTGGNAVGLHFEESDGTFGFQLYGDGTSYGFLDAEWGNWDVKKITNGELYVDAGGGLQKVWHEGNDGSGSGLDADLLDGVQGSSYLRSDQSDTMSGTLAITHTNLAAEPYSGLTITNTSTSGTYFTGVTIDAVGQAHYRYKLNGALKWQTRVGAGNGTDDFRVYSWTGAADVLLGNPSGQWTASGDFRAPIFYDSNSTGSYVDPASASNVNALTATRIGVNAGGSPTTGWGISLYDGYASGEPPYGLMFAGRGTFGGHGPMGASDWATYFTMNNDTSRGWIFRRAGSGNSASITAGGLATFDDSVRTPIFYDSNNTGYYLDPAGASSVNRLIVGGGNGDFELNYSGGVSMYGNEINAGAKGTTGVLYLGQRNTSYITSPVSMRAPLFYDSNNTAYYVDPASGTRLGGFVGIGGSPGSDDGNWGARLNVGGVPHARFDVICQNDGIVTTMYSHQGHGVGRVGMTSNHPLMLMAQGSNAGGYVYNGSLRSPIFYDSNDTGYYADPASTSVMQRVYGLDSTFTAPGSKGTYVWVRASMGGFNSGLDVVRFTISRSISDNSSSPYGGPSAEFSVFSREWHSGQEFCSVLYGEHGSSSGAGGYYISHAGPRDLASGGYWFYMRLEGGITYKVRRDASSGPISNFSSTTDPGGVPAINNHGYNLLYSSGQSGTTPGIYSKGSIYSDGSEYSNAYYDRSDTSFYADPNSDSRMSRLLVGDSGNYIRIGDQGEGYNSSYARIRTDSSGNLLLDAKDGQNIFLSWYTGTSARVWSEAGAGFPIYYDRNDTGYYVDPASTSYLSAVQAYSYQGNGNVAGTGNASYHPSGIYSTGTNWLYGTMYMNGNSQYMSGGSMYSTNQIVCDQNYGEGVYGVYSSYRYQHVWMMSTSYKLASNGTSVGNAYGMSFTHPNVGTGTNQAIAGLSHQLQGRENGNLVWALGTGIWTAYNITAYSDRAVKTNLEIIPDALAKVCQLNGYTYDRTDYKPDPLTGVMPETRQAGVVAQEVEKVLPEVVSGEEGNKAVAYGNMVALLIEAIKEQQTQIEAMAAEIKSLKEMKQ